MAKVYSIDENLWGRTVECGPIEDPWAAPPADAFVLTAEPLRRPRPTSRRRSWSGSEAGVPVTLDGAALDAASRWWRR